MIYTHHFIDLDAAASVWFYRRFVAPDQSVAFQPANWDGGGAEAGAVILDMDCGLKGEKAADGRVHACFATLVRQYASPDDQAALADVCRYIDLQDSTGNAVRALGVSEASAARVLTATGLNALLRGFHRQFPDDDAVVLAQMSLLFDILLEQGRSAVRAEQEADQATWLGPVAISRNVREFATMDVLFARGAQAVVAVDGANLGVVRGEGVNARLDHPAIRALTAGEDRWFFHSAGFMAARGTRKAPVATPSRISPEQLAAVVEEVIGEK